jgi:hypothetical protein
MHAQMVKVLDSMYSSLGQALNPDCLWPPNCDGYLVEQKLLHEWCQMMKMRLRKSEFQYQ